MSRNAASKNSITDASVGATVVEGGVGFRIGGGAAGIGGSVAGIGGSVAGIGGSIAGIGGSVAGIGGSVAGIGGGSTGTGVTPEEIRMIFSNPLLPDMIFEALVEDLTQEFTDGIAMCYFLGDCLMCLLKDGSETCDCCTRRYDIKPSSFASCTVELCDAIQQYFVCDAMALYTSRDRTMISECYKMKYGLLSAFTYAHCKKLTISIRPHDLYLIMLQNFYSMISIHRLSSKISSSFGTILCKFISYDISSSIGLAYKHTGLPQCLNGLTIVDRYNKYDSLIRYAPVLYMNTDTLSLFDLEFEPLFSGSFEGNVSAAGSPEAWDELSDAIDKMEAIIGVEQEYFTAFRSVVSMIRFNAVSMRSLINELYFCKDGHNISYVPYTVNGAMMLVAYGHLCFTIKDNVVCPLIDNATYSLMR